MLFCEKPTLDTQKIYRIFGGFRRERMSRFLQEFNFGQDQTILDVGGFSGFWSGSGVCAQITILRPEGPENLPHDTPANIRSISGDGCDLGEHADKSFDLVFSNSVIEHVGDKQRQRAFAREALRVGRSAWVQTPAYEFPIEPHLLTPFIHWLPHPLPEKLIPISVWGLLRTAKEREEWIEHARARLLSAREMRELFPDAELIIERFLFLPKSYIALTRQKDQPSRT